jgi:hypothetical protein
VDPGPHAILAKAPGFRRYLSTIEVGEKQIKRITVALEEIPKEPDADSASKATSPISAASVPSSPSLRVVPYVIGGVGAVALLNAGVFYLLRHGKESDLQNLCGPDRDCTNANPRPLVGDEVSRSSDMNDKLKLYSTVSGISAVTGILALGVAGVWVIAEPKQPRPMAAWAIEPAAPGAQLGGLSVVGAF